MYLSITGVTPEGKLTKYQPFPFRGEALAHAAKYDGFVIAEPEGSPEFWIINAATRSVSIDEDLKTTKENEALDAAVITARLAEYGTPREQLANIIENGLKAEQARVAAIKLKHKKR